MATKVPFDNPAHYENPGLYTRGLRLSNFSELLFVSGYSASSGPNDGSGPPQVEYPNDATKQAGWIVRSLDIYLGSIPYADNSGYYSKNDIIYFDVVLADSVPPDDQQNVLDILQAWFETVTPPPAAGILKRIASLVTPGMVVEIEFLLAH
jgi:enamine deaminase RidA (YjgF/YER057c/UK114 family)